jgi:hypothetical protein
VLSGKRDGREGWSDSLCVFIVIFIISWPTLVAGLHSKSGLAPVGDVFMMANRKDLPRDIGPALFACGIDL